MCLSIIDKYIKRPNYLSNISFIEFVANYDTINLRNKKKKSHIIFYVHYNEHQNPKNYYGSRKNIIPFFEHILKGDHSTWNATYNMHEIQTYSYQILWKFLCNYHYKFLSSSISSWCKSFQNIANNIDSLAPNFWMEKIKCYELKQVMLQSDEQFINILNWFQIATQLQLDVNNIINQCFCTPSKDPKLSYLFYMNGTKKKHNESTFLWGEGDVFILHA
jgi:hypothetical protein